MDAELKSLDEKISQFVALHKRLRADNHELRQQLASAQSENKQLLDKIGGARIRLEALLTQVPEDPT